MILSNRAQPAPSRSHISYPINPELAPCLSSPELLASTHTTPPRGHSKHSFSKPMTWLNRSSSSTSTHSTAPRAAPKPTRISEPKVGSSLDQLSLRRSGPLGSGATIVRTPQEALSGSAHRLSEDDGVKQDILSRDTENNESKLAQRPSSPPLPPLPDVPDTEEGDALSGSTACTSLSDHVPPTRSSSSPSHISSPRPTLVAHSRAPSHSAATFPSDPNLTMPQPTFDAVLLSSIPDGAIDPSKLIVTLETCTTTYRILLRSLVSRPSHLSSYITSLLSPVSETASIHSNLSNASSTRHRISFSAFFRDHLVSSGCLPRFTSIHVFLDRPSAPYEHVLAYLRSVPSTPEHPETLPRAVQLGSTSSPSSARLESLLELRDEASYLGLAELERLCYLEIRRFQRAALLGFAGVMPRVQTPSVHSIHTVVEESPTRQEVLTRPSEFRVSTSNSGSRRTPKTVPRESSSGSSLENKEPPSRERGRQVRGPKFEVGSPPPGWI